MKKLLYLAVVVAGLITVGCSKDQMKNRMDVLIIETHRNSAGLEFDQINYKVSADVHLSQFTFETQSGVYTLDNKLIPINPDTSVAVWISLRENLTDAGNIMMDTVRYRDDVNFIKYY